MVTNKHPITGIAYGIIACQNLDYDVVYTLLYEKGKDLSYEQACQEETAQQRKEFDSAIEELRRWVNDETLASVAELFEPDLNNFEPQIEEPIVEGEYQGVKYHTTWLGGAQMLWVLESPHIEPCRPCSPCAPGAGDLDNPEPNGMLTYSVPPDWRERD